MALIVKTIGSAGGRDYSTIVAWVAALPANLVTDGNSYEGDCYNDAIFDDGQVNLNGHTTDATHTITLTTAAGQSFRDKAGNALNYNQANGAALTRSVSGSSTVSIGDDFTTLSGLQIRHTAGGSGGAVRGGAGVANQHVVANFCIMTSDTTNASICSFDDGTILRSCLFIRLAQGTGAGIAANEGSITQTITAYFCDFVAPSDISAPASALFLTTGSTFVTENCAFFGCTAVNGSAGTYTHTTGMSDVASPPTGVTGSKTYANQFQNTTTASGDYRLKPGADLRGAATADATNGATDILGTQRPQLMRWDIGAMEFPQPYMDAEFPGPPKRRRPWRAGAEPNEFLFNPTQTVFARWGFDEPRQREPRPIRRSAWRAGPQSLGDEFLLNPTQTVFANWGFDEPRQREPQPVRRKAWRAGAELSDTGNLGPVQLVGVPWAFDEPVQREIGPIRRKAWRATAQSLGDEFLRNPTQTAFILWGGIDEEAHRLKYRIVWRAAAQSLSDEFLLNPTQAVFVRWGYDEPQYQQIIRRRRWFQVPSEDIGLVQLVGVPWGHDEPPFQRIARRPWRSFPRQEAIDDIGAVKLVGSPWLDEQAARPLLRRSLLRSQPDSEGLPFTAAARAAWSDIEERSSPRRAKRQSLTRSEEDIGPVQLVGAPWGFDEPPFQRVVRNRWFSREQPDNVDIGAVQLVGAPWFDEQPVTLRQRRAILRSQLDEFLKFTSVIVPSTWPDIDWWQHPQRLAWHARPQSNDIEGLPFTSVVTPFVWADIEEWHRVRRAAARIAQASGDITEVGPIAPSNVTWFPEEFRRVLPRQINPRPSEELIIPGAAAVALAWGWEGDLSSRIRRATRPQSRADEVFPSPLILPQPWPDPDQQQHLRPPSSLSLWRSRVIWQYPWEGWPFIPPIPPTPPVHYIPFPSPNRFGLMVIDLADFVEGPIDEVLAFQSLPQWPSGDFAGSATFVAVSRPLICPSPTSGDRRAIALRILAGYSTPIRLKLDVITMTGKRYSLRTR